MRKVLIVMLALFVLLSLGACGTPTEGGSSSITQGGNNESNTGTNTPAEDGFVFTVNGINIAMHAPAADILAALGEHKGYTEQASCAFDGLDKTYFYGSFYLQTYPNGGSDYIYGLWLVDDTVTTAEDIYIGASQQAVENAYGADAFDGANSFVVTKGRSVLTIIMENGVVSSIQYDAVLD